MYGWVEGWVVVMGFVLFGGLGWDECVGVLLCGGVSVVWVARVC